MFEKILILLTQTRTHTHKKTNNNNKLDQDLSFDDLFITLLPLFHVVINTKLCTSKLYMTTVRQHKNSAEFYELIIKVDTTLIVGEYRVDYGRKENSSNKFNSSPSREV